MEHTLADVTSLVVFSSPSRIVNKLFGADMVLKVQGLWNGLLMSLFSVFNTK